MQPKSPTDKCRDLICTPQAFRTATPLSEQAGRAQEGGGTGPDSWDVFAKNMSCSDLVFHPDPTFSWLWDWAGLQLFIGYLCALDAQHLLALSLWPWEEGLFPRQEAGPD